jgi:type IV secretory pathway VirB2 component (pilin)
MLTHAYKQIGGFEEEMLRKLNSLRLFTLKQVRQTAVALTATLAMPANASAQVAGNSPWESAVNVLQQSFTGTIAKGLSLVAIVVGGLTFAFGEGAGKRTFAGIVFGVGMAVLAVNFLSWLFGV